MPKKIKLKTSKNNQSPTAFLNSIEDERLKKDCKILMKVFREATGLRPKMWGSSIIGFGEYTYFRSNGDEGQFLATGFSPRKSGPTIYIMPGYSDYSSELKKLGPYKLGKSCLYLKSLEGINLKTLSRIIKRSLKDLKKDHNTNF